jgi:hypothetical protein
MNWCVAMGERLKHLVAHSSGGFAHSRLFLSVDRLRRVLYRERTEQQGDER